MNLGTDTRHEPIREMQYRLLRQEFWTADIRQGLRTKIEQSNSQTSHYGPAMAAVFRGLIQGERSEKISEAITQPTFYLETDPSNPRITNVFEIITATPPFRNMSQEVRVF
jgi:hypothetical protein